MSYILLPTHWTKEQLLADRQRLIDALKEIVAELNISYLSECDEVDWYNNNMPNVGQSLPYKSRPNMPKALKIATDSLNKTSRPSPPQNTKES